MLNQADYGGAIYVDDDKEPTAVCSGGLLYQAGCFFQNITNGLMINLTKNVAAVRGGDLFGGLLDRCTVVNSANSSEVEMNGTSRFLNISSIENFDTISSKAVRVCLCIYDLPGCTQETYLIPIEQAKVNEFTVHLAAVDQVGHPVTEAMILSKFNDGIVSASRTVQTNSTSCSSLEFQVTFPEASKQYKLSIFADGPCNNKSISTLTFDLDVVHCFCPPGFMPHDNSINCSCICDQKLSKQIENLECSIADESIIREGEFWVTFLGNSSSNNTFPSYSYYVYPRCPFDYCKPPSVQTPMVDQMLNVLIIVVDFCVEVVDQTTAYLLVVQSV